MALTPHSILVADAGRLLYGQDWQSAVARDFGLNLRTVQRIAAAAAEEKPYRVPPGLLDEMAYHLVVQAERCSIVANAIVDRRGSIEAAEAKSLHL